MYALLKSLVLPPGSLLLLMFLGLGWWRRRPVAGRRLVLVSALGLLVISLPLVSKGLMAPLEPYPALTAADLRQPAARAIVVLSGTRYTDAAEYGGDTVGALTLERVRYGALLQRRTGLPLIVAGGSFPDEYPSHAELMRRVLEEEFGVPVSALEDRSRTTWENAAYTAELLRDRGIRHVFLVSSAWHLPRAVAAFERAGVEVTPAPTAFAHDGDHRVSRTDLLPSAKALYMSYFALHEYLGRLWYGIKETIE